MATSFLRSIIKGIATSMGARIITMGLRFLTLCILPIWISPTEIGWMAVLMVITNLIIALSDLGLGTALVKTKECPTQMYQSVFTLTMLVAVAVSLALILGAPLLQNIFQVPAYLLIIAAFAIPTSSLTIVPNALLYRNLKFTGLALRDLLGEAAFSGTAITLAILGYTELCVAIALVAQRFVRWIAATTSIEWTPGFALNKAHLADLRSFSLYQFGTLSVIQIANRLDTLLLSIFLPPASFGFYTQGRQLSSNPTEALASATCSVFFAAFSKIQNDPKELRSLFIKFIKLIIPASFIISAGLYPALGLIPIFYSQTWAPSVELSRILCFSIPFYAFLSIEGIMITVGGERRRLFTTITRAVLMMLGICASFLLFPEFASATTIAWLVCVTMAVSVALNFAYLLSHFKITRTDAKRWLPLSVAGFLCLVASVVITHLTKI